MIKTKEELKKYPKASVYVREEKNGRIQNWKRKYNGVAINECDTHVLFVSQDDKTFNGEWLAKQSKRLKTEVQK